jgi:hypothetical protein
MFFIDREMLAFLNGVDFGDLYMRVGDTDTCSNMGPVRDYIPNILATGIVDVEIIMYLFNIYINRYELETDINGNWANNSEMYDYLKGGLERLQRLKDRHLQYGRRQHLDMYETRTPKHKEVKIFQMSPADVEDLARLYEIPRNQLTGAQLAMLGNVALIDDINNEKDMLYDYNDCLVTKYFQRRDAMRSRIAPNVAYLRNMDM